MKILLPLAQTYLPFAQVEIRLDKTRFFCDLGKNWELNLGRDSRLQVERVWLVFNIILPFEKWQKIWNTRRCVIKYLN